MTALLHSALDCLPGRCLMCNDSLPRHQRLLCAPCRQDLPRNPTCCPQCAQPLPDTELCPGCLMHAPPFDRTIAPFLYLPPLASLINRWKHAGDSRVLALLIPMMQTQLLHAYQHDDWPELLVPVPIHWRRRMHRGFNQTEQVARRLGAQLHLPMASDLLQSRHTGHSQQGLNKRQRQQNLAGHFSVTRPPVVEHLALIDDVMTTGATATHLATLLKDEGVKRVDIWILARTP